LFWRIIFFIVCTTRAVLGNFSDTAARETSNEPKDNGGNSTPTTRVKTAPISANLRLVDEKHKSLKKAVDDAKQTNHPKPEGREGLARSEKVKDEHDPAKDQDGSAEASSCLKLIVSVVTAGIPTIAKRVLEAPQAECGGFNGQVARERVGKFDKIASRVCKDRENQGDAGERGWSDAG